MTYFEYSIEMDKLELQLDLCIGNILNDQIYQESVGSFFNKLINSILSYINDVRHLHQLYKEKKKIAKGIQYIQKLSKNNTIGNQIIYVRGYNGKIVDPLTLEDEVQAIKNLITYSKLKINDPIVSDYLKRYEIYKSGWDTFYKVKIKNVPYLYDSVNQKLDDSINELKSTLKNLSSYFENASDKRQNNDYQNIFKVIINRIKTALKKDINIITMNLEAIQYEIGKKFSNLTKETADKLVHKNISDNMIMKNSEFIKEIKYGENVYKVYKSKYDNVSALNYGGSVIYVDNKFFDLPEGYQLAILYHEIGHAQCKHFKPEGFDSKKDNNNDITLEDTEKIVAHLKQDLNKFLYQLNFSPFYNDKNYTNGEEFIYLLVEWEADRFSANIVGKRLMRKALTSHFADALKANPIYKDPKKEALNYRYNMDRMRLRTSNI